VRFWMGAEVVEVAARMGVHRATVHRWVGRYLTDQLAGLADRSHRPRSVSASHINRLITRNCFGTASASPPGDLRSPSCQPRFPAEESASRGRRAPGARMGNCRDARLTP
jgi:transposase-like protein